MEPEETGINHNRLIKAYLRLSEETKRISESPGSYSIRSELPKLGRKPQKSNTKWNQTSRKLFSTLVSSSTLPAC